MSPRSRHFRDLTTALCAMFPDVVIALSRVWAHSDTRKLNNALWLFAARPIRASEHQVRVAEGPFSRAIIVRPAYDGVGVTRRGSGARFALSEPYRQMDFRASGSLASDISKAKCSPASFTPATEKYHPAMRQNFGHNRVQIVTFEISFRSWAFRLTDVCKRCFWMRFYGCWLPILIL